MRALGVFDRRSMGENIKRLALLLLD